MSPFTTKDQEGVIRRVAGLIANSMHSVQILKGEFRTDAAQRSQRPANEGS